MNKRIIFVFVLAIFALNSCMTVKDIAYFQNKAVNHPEKIDDHAGIVIQPKDMLSVVVSSKNPELIKNINTSAPLWQGENG